MNGLIIDNFAGGGGASTGIEAALGRAVDIAINHDEEAIRMHEVNHPGTMHIRNNIWQIDPRDIVKGRKVDLAWFSPDCKHFSKAKGGKPREKSIRDLAWIVVLWAQRVQPDLILLENVEEFRTWGPLCDAGMPIKERAGETFEKWCKELRRAGYKLQFRELRACDYGAPTIRKRFFMIARRDGKPIVWPKPTHGKPGSPEVLSGNHKPWRTASEIIDWSIPCPSIFERKKPLAEKTLRRIAHGIMKFVVNNPAPFIVPLTHHQAGARGASVDQPMATVTGANRGEHAIVAPHITKFRSGAIGHGVDEPMHTITANSFIKRPGGSAPLGVVEASAVPFMTYAQQGGASRSVEDPLHTVTASNKDQNCVAAAVLQKFASGNAPTDPFAPLQTIEGNAKHSVVAAFMQKFAQNGQGVDPSEPLHTVMAGAPRHAVVCAHLEQANGGPNNENLAGRPADAPLSTVATTGSQQRLVTSNLVKLRGGEQSHLESCGVPVGEPMHTVCASGTHMAEVRAFLIKYYGNEEDGHGLTNPLGTVTVQDRFGLVTVTIEGEEYVIVDIGMRMLTPRELFNAQGFPADYIIDVDAHGKPITKTAQVAKCGNSVCPPLSEALVRANMADEIAAREVQAA
ncbi:DNA cytosine methyltransferase [Novosphingobium sp. AP12]|uniref:DNA cytosine methyltransferase n=1 Tax=Novosphingobium sp. AP12 TaxID=1144305 RepID=UPI000271E2EB|nr:DNA cytosine methyltransferase [Novosphingobium sp. AP12]EJL21932.1 site-specific DNA methylase [Novosphingobium sp. AP12]